MFRAGPWLARAARSSHVSRRAGAIHPHPSTGGREPFRFDLFIAPALSTTTFPRSRLV